MAANQMILTGHRVRKYSAVSIARQSTLCQLGNAFSKNQKDLFRGHDFAYFFHAFHSVGQLVPSLLRIENVSVAFAFQDEGDCKRLMHCELQYRLHASTT